MRRAFISYEVTGLNNLLNTSCGTGSAGYPAVKFEFLLPQSHPNRSPHYLRQTSGGVGSHRRTDSDVTSPSEIANLGSAAAELSGGPASNCYRRQVWPLKSSCKKSLNCLESKRQLKLGYLNSALSAATVVEFMAKWSKLYQRTIFTERRIVFTKVKPKNGKKVYSMTDGQISTKR